MVKRKSVSTAGCTIYGTGLSEEAIWKVAQHHNSFNQVHQNTTFVEVAAKCNKGVCFKHFGNGDDDGSFNAVVPRYNTTQYYTISDMEKGMYQCMPNSKCGRY